MPEEFWCQNFIFLEVRIRDVSLWSTMDRGGRRGRIFSLEFHLLLSRRMGLCRLLRGQWRTSSLPMRGRQGEAVVSLQFQETYTCRYSKDRQPWGSSSLIRPELSEKNSLWPHAYCNMDHHHPCTYDVLQKYCWKSFLQWTVFRPGWHNHPWQTGQAVTYDLTGEDPSDKNKGKDYLPVTYLMASECGHGLHSRDSWQRAAWADGSELSSGYLLEKDGTKLLVRYQGLNRESHKGTWLRASRQSSGPPGKEL